MRYRPEIDGLRAIAVLAVIFYHAGFHGFSGGYVGVDIFFVISGFLITSIIMRDLTTGRFSFAHFYERRARRILPALFLVMATSIPFAWLLLTPYQMKDYAQSMVSIPFFASNIFFFLKSGYFEQASELKPLIHSWSLAVEEQYYIIFPFILILIHKWRAAKIYIVICAIILLSLICAEWLKNYNESANFFLLPSRMWELGIGALLAIYFKGRDNSPRGAETLSCLGIVMICGAVFLFNEHTPHPSLVTLVPVIGTALVIYAAREGTFVYKLLSLRGVVLLGLMSYSAYLWHQPIFAFARLHIDAPLYSPIYGLLICLTFILSWYSWQYVEKPFRNKKRISRRTLILFTVFASILFVGLGVIGHLKQGFPERYGAKVPYILAQQKQPHPYYGQCLQNYHMRTLDEMKKICVYGNQIAQEIDVIIWGDSHAAGLGYGLHQYLKETPLAALQLTARGCPSAPDITRKDNPKMRMECPKNAQKALDIIKVLRPKYVLISTRWALHFESVRFDNGEGGKESGVSISIEDVMSGKEMAKPEMKAYYIEYFTQLAAKLALQNTKLVLITQIPEAGWNVPNKSIRFIQQRNHDEVATLRSVYEQRNLWPSQMFEELKAVENIHIVNAADIYCDAEYCYNTENKIPYYADDDHLSMLGSQKAAPYILKSLGIEERVTKVH